ncbi:zinc finger protein [Stylonychia lemnae]|uniref:Zinc finger protein n=1 Tax=Stylonychia lemnae TaxID=5949 RepID=A0A078AGU7_STYLE|nr:zinc finger protein [Stylonychia lemnae]|eukprot:CDW80752.1 zinc finger protein [Stylonychia lemnae]
MKKLGICKKISYKNLLKAQQQCLDIVPEQSCSNHDQITSYQREFQDSLMNSEIAQPKFKTKYKTEMCHNWDLYGFCSFGDQCSFAHGRDELHLIDRNPYKYKTKLCKQYHQHMYCPYGKRCQFLHDQTEKKIMNQNSSYQYKLQNLVSQVQKEPNNMSKLLRCPNSQQESALASRLKVFKEIAHQSVSNIKSSVLVPQIKNSNHKVQDKRTKNRKMIVICEPATKFE